MEDDYEDDCSNYEKNEVAIDYNAGFTASLAGLIKFRLGERDPQDILHFERVGQNFLQFQTLKFNFLKLEYL